MTRTVNIACLQTSPMPDFESASVEALDLAKQAVDAGAKFLTLPEYCGGLLSQGSSFAPPAAEEARHPVLSDLREFASQQRVWILVGSVAVTNENGQTVNRSFIVDDCGNIVSRYDKIHMFDIDLASGESYRESDTITPGSKAVVVDTPFGKVGHSICYDLRFPELYQTMARAGAEILAVPAAFTKKTGEAHWHVLNRARAIENGAFIVAPCAIGPVNGGGASYGHSLIVDPWGEVMADGGAKPGFVTASIDLDSVSKARNRIPNLRNDRPFNMSIHNNEPSEREVA